MLPPRTKTHIRQSMPDTYGLYYDPSAPAYGVDSDEDELAEGWRDYDLEIRQSMADFGNSDNTEVFVQPITEGQLRQDATPLDQVLGQIDDPNSPDVYELQGERLYDEWQLTVLDSGREYGVPASKRVGWATHWIKKWFRTEALETLYRDVRDMDPTDGPDSSPFPEDADYGLIPVRPELVDGGADESGMTDDRATRRHVFPVRLNYTLSWPVLRRAVERLEGTISVDDIETGAWAAAIETSESQ